MSTATYLDTAAAAKMIRADLKAAFPGTKFSVRTSRYAGGSSIDVEWTDGPTHEQADPIAMRYNGRYFDGMDDSTSYEAITASDGKVYRTGCFVFCRRNYSVAAMQAALEAEREWWGGPEGEAMQAATVAEGSKGAAYVVTAGMNGRMADFVHRAIRERLEGKRDKDIAALEAAERFLAAEAAPAAAVEPTRPALYVVPPADLDEDEPDVNDEVTATDEYTNDFRNFFDI